MAAVLSSAPVLRPSSGMESRHSRMSDMEGRRRSNPLGPMGSRFDISIPPVPPILSPPATPRAPSIRNDRLSLRLRSGSGLSLHTNEAALSQYIDYQKMGTSRPPSLAPSRDDALPRSVDVLAARAQRQSRQSMRTVGDNTLPYFDLLSRDAFQIAFNDPTASRHLARYCEDRGCEEHVEFLTKLREYSKATNDMAAVLTSITTTYISSSASKPLRLAPAVAKPLTADIKNIAYSMLPSLESVFADARIHIEERLTKEIFPGFLKNQLAFCTAAALSGGASGNISGRLEYPGLGEAFCLTDATGSNNPVLAASEALASLTGFTLAEIGTQDCGLFQGPFTNMASVGRIRKAVQERREAIELVLNHRKDGEAFWNLLFLFPLIDLRGQLRYWLGAQMSVSEAIGNRKDLLRVLNRGRTPVLDPSSSEEDTSIESLERGRASRLERVKSVQSPSIRSSSSRGRFFSSFSRKSTLPPSPPLPEPPYDCVPSPLRSRDAMPSSKFSTRPFQPLPEIQSFNTAYSRYMVLQVDQRKPAGGKKSSASFSVAFYSDAAAELLGIRGDMFHLDIFYVLGERANSPSVTKTFRFLIRERMETGQATSIELVLERGKKGRRNSITRSPQTDSEETWAERERRLAKNKGQERVMSHWTPLRDARGDVNWVVLILTTAM